jgi:hypothetical protein
VYKRIGSVGSVPKIKCHEEDEIPILNAWKPVLDFFQSLTRLALAVVACFQTHLCKQ